MPNHIKNIITLKGDEQKIREMLEEIQYDELGLGTVDFNKIIPMPESLNVESGSRTDKGIEMVKTYLENMPEEQRDKEGTYDEFFEDLRSHSAEISDEEEKKIWNIGVTAVENLHKYGAPTWYEWCTNNWGTKWNAYGYDEGTDYSASGNLHFQTAWSAPHPVIKKLAQMYPDIIFEHEWADEDIGVNCGRKCYSNGECTEEYCPESEKDGIEFACRIWNYDPAELDLMLNKSETAYINIENEKYDLIELLGKPALFSNGRLTDTDIPKGLFVYHLRHDDSGCSFAAVEPNVKVNHASTVITDEPIDFGEQGYISFTEDTAPNFMGEEMTFGEYMQGEFEETQGESQQSGGMQL